MSDEDFLRRWSRRKHGASQAAGKAAQAAPAAPPELPSPDSLTFESDFKAFMRSEVEESVKRAALKKLFQDPRFNVIDPLDVDIDDYSKLEPLSEEAVKALEYAKRALSAEPKGQEKPAARADTNGTQDGDPGQDA